MGASPRGTQSLGRRAHFSMQTRPKGATARVHAPGPVASVLPEDPFLYWAAALVLALATPPTQNPHSLL